MSLGVGIFASSGGAAPKTPPSVSYVTKNGVQGTTSGTTTAISLGTAASDRSIILLCRASHDDSVIVTRTLGGAAMPKIFEELKSGTYFQAFAMDIPSGTSANLVLKSSTLMSLTFFVYAVYGLSDLGLFAGKTVASGTTTSTTLDIPANGVAFGWRQSVGGVNGAPGTSWTGVTRDTTTTGGANTGDASAGHFITTPAVTGRTISASTNYAGPMGVISMGNGP